jgi:tRNA nucleotidyltransferase/poly(A) polymerase
MMDFNIDALPRRKGVYIVGGSLRDRLLGRIPTDVDIAVHGDPEPFAHELATKLNSRVIAMGRQAHPMFRVVTQNRIFDISPLQGTTIEEDLRQRDFTVNALAYEILSAKIIDVAHGLQDIQAPESISNCSTTRLPNRQTYTQYNPGQRPFDLGNRRRTDSIRTVRYP